MMLQILVFAFFQGKAYATLLPTKYDRTTGRCQARAEYIMAHRKPMKGLKVVVACIPQKTWDA